MTFLSFPCYAFDRLGMVFTSFLATLRSTAAWITGKCNIIVRFVCLYLCAAVWVCVSCNRNAVCQQRATSNKKFNENSKQIFEYSNIMFRRSSTSIQHKDSNKIPWNWTSATRASLLLLVFPNIVTIFVVLSVDISSFYCYCCFACISRFQCSFFHFSVRIWVIFRASTSAAFREIQSFLALDEVDAFLMCLFCLSSGIPLKTIESAAIWYAVTKQIYSEFPKRKCLE